MGGGVHVRGAGGGGRGRAWSECRGGGRQGVCSESGSSSKCGQWAVGGPETGGMSEHVGRRGGMHMHGVGNSEGGECA